MFVKLLPGISLMLFSAVMAIALSVGLPAVSEASGAQTEQAPSDDISALTYGNTSLALDLYKELKEEKGNLFFSPLSVSTAVAMTYAGADGQAAKAIEDVFRFPTKGEELHQSFELLTKKLETSDDADDEASDDAGDGPLFTLANSLWPQKDSEILQSFFDVINQYYGSRIFPVDYRNNEPQAREDINEWVAEATRDKILNFLPSPVSNSTTLILINAVYFKGKWESPFNPELTIEGDFQAESGPIKAQFMNAKDHFNYFESTELQAIELPYAGEDLSMVILLPANEQSTLTDLENSLNSEKLQSIVNGLAFAEVELSLPRFSLTWGTTSLRPALEKLGLGPAFGPNADYSKMTADSSNYLSDVLHKAFVEVNEEGTEAAAATGGMVRATAMELKPTIFKADHPFIFLIQEKSTNSLLFIGRLAAPAE
ncbi:MAG: serpin family protein [Deltaproteobacteria bacterium]|jgi:serpin B|nr:serpin family protein [Deltaproteobacteria bacterium]